MGADEGQKQTICTPTFFVVRNAKTDHEANNVFGQTVLAIGPYSNGYMDKKHLLPANYGRK